MRGAAGLEGPQGHHRTRLERERIRVPQLHLHVRPLIITKRPLLKFVALQVGQRNGRPGLRG